MQVWNLKGRQLAAFDHADLGKPPWEWITQMSADFSKGYSRRAVNDHSFQRPSVGRVSWILAATLDEQVVKFSADGRVIDGDPAVFDREFACIIEQPNGAIELVKPSEFARRYFIDSSKPGDRGK